jgi:cellulose biosynthesis protein BcsQ
MILDCNPSFNIINQNAMYVADSIVTITDIGRNSFKGVKLVCQLWQETCDDLGIENTIKGMVINKYDKTIKLSKEFMFFIEDNEIFKKLAFDTVIPDNVKLKETEIVSLPIVIHHTKNQGYKEFMELMEEFKQREII